MSNSKALFVRHHNLTEIFWHFADTSAGPDECWPWRGRRSLQNYGRVMKNGKFYAAHRLSLMVHNIDLPDGLTTDHLCHTNDPDCISAEAKPCSHRLCVNPRHLEMVTMRENILRSSGPAAKAARKTHCPQGHPLAPGNLLNTTSGYRICLKCKTSQSRAGRHKVEQRQREERALLNPTKTA